MRILKNLSKLAAAAMLAGSIMTLPAMAQHHGGHGKSSSGFHHKPSQFHGHNRGNFRHHNRGFRGNHRGQFRGNRFNRRGFNQHRFGSSRFGHNGFRGNRFGHNRFSHNRFGHNGFRGNRFGHSGFNRGFRGNHRGNFRGRNRGFVSAPVYSVGGFYGVTNRTVFISDFSGHGLYAPPQGHHWVCDKGSKDAVLVAIATGAIIAVAADALLNPY